jgi:hypothetical protein
VETNLIPIRSTRAWNADGAGETVAAVVGEVASAAWTAVVESHRNAPGKSGVAVREDADDEEEHAEPHEGASESVDGPPE